MDTPGGDTLFARIGGQPAVDRLVDAFYARMSTLPEAAVIRAMHADDLGPVKDVLKSFLGQWMGGPPRYSEARGHPRLRARHLPFAIGAAERDAWMLCMTGALDEVVADPDLRGQLAAAFSRLADWMRNRDLD
ncbi:MAG: group II truncated hemoglobin [Bauldia sp.]|nr:group II truncated hemoglobin [Bauldia sp.]